MSAPVPTHVLGVDQAMISGWGIAPVGGRVIESGVARERGMREGVIMRAIELAGGPERLLFVFEDHTDIPLTNRARYDHRTRKGPERTTASLIGMGRALGRWEGLLDHHGHPDRLRIGVTSEDWRIRVLGCSNKPGTDALKQKAQIWAQAHRGIVASIDHNEAEGVCITAWGALDGISVLEHGRESRRVQARSKRARTRQLGFGGM